METNIVGTIINVEEKVKSCRVFDGKELLRLLRFNISIFWSWGADKFTIDNNRNTRMFRMYVNGHHHKGYVYIFLNGLDLFDVYLTDKKGEIKVIGEGLYNDMLVEWIDEKVEKIADYTF